MDNWKKMAGTERTFKYLVVAATDKGRVGYRNLGCGQYRVRIEPTAGSEGELAGKFEGWKQPDSQCRYSTVVNQANLQKALKQALETLGQGHIAINTEAPEWAQELAKGPPAEPPEQPQPEEGEADSLSQKMGKTIEVLDQQHKALLGVCAALQEMPDHGTMVDGVVSDVEKAIDDLTNLVADLEQAQEDLDEAREEFQEAKTALDDAVEQAKSSLE